MAEATRKTILYFRDGKSDKLYEAEVVREGDGFVVKFAYGRRGSALKTGTKTPQPVARDVAEAIYDKLLGEKRAKGYAAAAAPTAPAAAGVAAGVAAATVKPLAAPSRQDVLAEVSDALRDFERQAANALRGCPPGGTDIALTFNARVDRKHEVNLEWHRVVDPAFGPLSTGGDLWWTTRRPIAGFGDDDVKIHVDIPNHSERRKSKDRVPPPPPPQPPTAKQRDAFRKFMHDPARVRRVLEQANWQFYRENIYEGEDDGYPPEVTGVEEPAEVWKLLSDGSITIPVQAGAGWWIEFNWECRWDREHGHKVVLRNGKVNYIGQQGGA